MTWNYCGAKQYIAAYGSARCVLDEEHTGQHNDGLIGFGPRTRPTMAYKLSGYAGRSYPTAKTRRIVTERQDGRCLYCDLPIGTYVVRRGLPVELRTAWDHFVPYAYSGANQQTNFVLACHVCNAIKLAKIFRTVVEAQDYIRPRRVEIGYEPLTIGGRP